MRVGFSTIYSWRPHVEHAYFLASLVERAGHSAHFLTCDADLPTCYTRELRDRSAWRECLQCRLGGIRSYTDTNISSIGDLAAKDMGHAEREWSFSSASTLGRFEAAADYAGEDFSDLVARLHPTVQMSYRAARAWIVENRLDAVCVFNGRMDATRAIFEAARSLGVRVVSLERTWFGDGLQLYPDENCLGLGSVHRLIRQWRDLPLTKSQAFLAASYGARRFLRQNNREWRAYNVNAETARWPLENGRRRILLVPSSLNEVWGHEDWKTSWTDPLQAYDALIAHLGLAPEDILLRCHPNWAEHIGRRGGELSERHYAEWANARNVRIIPSDAKASTLELIEQADAIVVANGSAALEAGLLGKQVIGIAPSIYQEAGFRDSAMSASELAALRLHTELSPSELGSVRESIARRTLRFAYTMIHRVPQYTNEVRALATTDFRYAGDVDPGRFINLLQGGELQADDEAHDESPDAENEVLERIALRDWQSLIGDPRSDPRTYWPLRRRLMFRPVDGIRSRMPLGDR